MIKSLKQEIENGTYKLLPDEEMVGGVIFCKNCKTSRLYISPDKEWYVKGVCACAIEKFEAERQHREKVKNFEKYKSLHRSSLLGKRYTDKTFEGLDLNRPQDFLKAVDIFKDYYNNWKENESVGKGVYIYGDCGTGKTLLTACLGNALIKDYVPVIFTSIIDIAANLRNALDFSSEQDEIKYLKELANVPLLILDDLGAENLTKATREKVYQIINSRYYNSKATIFSSNLSPTELLDEKGYDERTVERIFEMSQIKIELRGDSYRLLN